MFAAISDLKTEIRAVEENVEAVAMTHGVAIQQVQRASTVQAQHLMEMHMHLEDLDNRGRRWNL